jgi:arabinofuranosyltransferase
VKPARREAVKARGASPVKARERGARTGANRPPNPFSPPVRVALLAGMALFVLHAALMRHFVIDDAYIFYRVARNLAGGFGPVFNPGERVEAFSSPLFTFLLAPFAAPGAGLEALPAIARAIGLAAALGSLIALATLPLPGGVAATTLALLLCAASTSMTLWSLGGLETALYGLLLIAALAWTLRSPRRAPHQFALGLLLSALALTRPEGVLPAAALLAWRWVDRATRREWAGHARVALAAALPLAGYLLFRHAYFGEWLPNTYYAKHIPLEMAVPRGLSYLADFFARNGGAAFYAPALVAIARARREPVVALAALVLAFYLPYVVAMGGDWMDAHRFVAPVIPLLSLLVAAGWVTVLGLARGALVSRGLPAAARAVVPAGVALAAAVLAWANVPGTRRVLDTPYVNARPYYATMGRLVANIAQPAWSVATDDIGAIGWYGRIAVLDLLGLANAELAHRRTVARVLIAQRLPELVILHYDDTPAPRQRWRSLRMVGFDSMYARPRGPVPLPGSLYVSRAALPWVEARLAVMPAAFDSELVALDSHLREHQPDMRPVPAGLAP